MLLVDVDDDFLDRLQHFAGRRRAGTAPSAARPKARSLRAAWSRSGCRAAIRRGRRPPSNPFPSDSEMRSATLPSASRSRRSRMTRLCTLSPSVPASGESLMRKVMASVGGSIGCAGSGSVDLGRAEGVRDGRLRQAGEGDDVAGKAFLDRRALQPAEGEHLGDAAVLDQRAVAVEHLDRLVRLDRAGGDAAGDDAAEIGIGFQDRAEHAERAVLDHRRRDVRGRPDRTAAPCPGPSGLSGSPPSSLPWPSRRGSGNRAALRWRRAPRTGRRLRWRPRSAGRPGGRPC